VGEVGGEDGGEQLDHGVFRVAGGVVRGLAPTGQVYQRRGGAVCQAGPRTGRPALQSSKIFANIRDSG
jgi:hypothetical protein